MKVREIKAKNILSKSQIYDYALNPYVGCQHGCVYCYAKFMKRFTGHKERWGEFVDVKINSPEPACRRQVCQFRHSRFVDCKGFLAALSNTAEARNDCATAIFLRAF